MAFSKPRQYALIVVLGGASAFVLLMVWIGIMLLLARHGLEIPAKEVFAGIVVTLLAFGMLPALHRGLYRTFWRNEERARLGLPAIEGTYLDGKEPMPPPAPKTPLSGRQQGLYAVCYVAGISLLFWAYLPLHHAALLLHFVGRHSEGRDSAGSLLGILLVYLPMAVLLLPLMFLLDKERKAILAGHYSPEDALRRKLKQDWLFSFVTALIATSFFCQFATGLVLRYL